MEDNDGWLDSYRYAATPNGRSYGAVPYMMKYRGYLPGHAQDNRSAVYGGHTCGRGASGIHVCPSERYSYPAGSVCGSYSYVQNNNFGDVHAKGWNGSHYGINANFYSAYNVSVLPWTRLTGLGSYVDSKPSLAPRPDQLVFFGEKPYGAGPYDGSTRYLPIGNVSGAEAS